MSNLRKDASTSAPRHSYFRANVWRGSLSGSSTANSGVYTAALKDAYTKAATIAMFLHARLGNARSVTEFRGHSSAQQSSFQASQPLVKRVAIGRAVVTIGARGPVVLAVRYRLSNGSTISVFGLSNAAAHGEPQGVDVGLSVEGKTLKEVNQRLDRDMLLLRNLAKRLGVKDAAISVVSLQFS